MSSWSAAEEVGRSQLGLISRTQARACGLADSTIARAVRAGRLSSACRGVFRFAAVTESWDQRALLPQLLRPGDTTLSHWTAGWLHRLAGIRRPHRIDVSINTNTKLALDGFDVHRVQSLRTGHRIGPHAVTSIGRTLVDLASVMRREAFTFAFDSATARYPREMQTLFQYVSTRPFRGRKGLSMLRDVFAERHGVLLESPLESRVWTALARSRLPLPTAQHPVGDVMRVDFVWARERVLLHVDGHAFHASRAALERDARQRNQLATEWVSFVVTHGTVETDDWLRQVRAALEQRAAQLRLGL